MSRIAILEPFSGIAGDMMLGALVDVGLDQQWLKSLPSRLSLDGVTVHIEPVMRAGIRCHKVDFDIPPQPHGRHLKHIKAIIDACDAPDDVKSRAMEAFTAIGTIEAEIHGTTIEKVHLHEVGAVDAILDIVGSIWGLSLLGVDAVYNTALQLGGGTVDAAHGTMPVPAPATLRLLEGLDVRHGPPDAGELVTPTGAALVRVLSRGAPPEGMKPIRSGYGAGTRDNPARANALRVTIAEVSSSDGARHEILTMLAADVDDMQPEYLAAAAHSLRDAGALDVIMLPAVMKKGRPGTRIEVLCDTAKAAMLRSVLLTNTTTLGVREHSISRYSLDREEMVVRSFGHDVRVKVAKLPDGTHRAKPEFDDVNAVAKATGRSALEVAADALHAAQHAMRGK
jgi:pyridinium-3,5-bisthiocarboxylic acid mononucleotide nickel chelatase